jgi:signal transduction histidine kinase
MAKRPHRLPRRPVSRLFSYFREFHEQEPWRLQYMGWFGAVGFFGMYFVRFLRPQYELFDDIFIRVPLIVMGVLMGIKEHWRPRFRRYYAVYCWWTIWLALPVALTYLCLVRDNANTSTTNFFLMLTFLVMLTDWRNMLVMLATGIPLASALYWNFHPAPVFPRELLQQVPAFVVILIGSIVVQRRVLSRLAESEARIDALRESVGFLAHELNTPLATVRGYLTMVRSAYVSSSEKLAHFHERNAGTLVNALENAEQRALYSQSLVSAFAQSTRRAHSDSGSHGVTAEELLRALLRDYPFEGNQRDAITLVVEEDFVLPARDLVYLVFSTAIQNSLEALAQQQDPQIQIKIGRCESMDGSRAITFTDNGPGIPPELLVLLTHKQVSSRGKQRGMGLLFASRVMLALGGSIKVSSTVGNGTKVSLLFDVKFEEEDDFNSQPSTEATALP